MKPLPPETLVLLRMKGLPAPPFENHWPKAMIEPHIRFPVLVNPKMAANLLYLLDL